jgi:hypothetical protein
MPKRRCICVHCGKDATGIYCPDCFRVRPRKPKFRDRLTKSMFQETTETQFADE